MTALAIATKGKRKGCTVKLTRGTATGTYYISVDGSPEYSGTCEECIAYAQKTHGARLTNG